MLSYEVSLNKSVAQTIRELRQNKGVSQEKLAEAINSHQVYISEIENGKKLPSLFILYNIAKFFDLTLTEFINLVESKI